MFSKIPGCTVGLLCESCRILKVLQEIPHKHDHENPVGLCWNTCAGSAWLFFWGFRLFFFFFFVRDILAETMVAMVTFCMSKKAKCLLPILKYIGVVFFHQHGI